jgi:hypothetical protein
MALCCCFFILLLSSNATHMFHATRGNRRRIEAGLGTAQELKNVLMERLRETIAGTSADALLPKASSTGLAL